MDDVFTDDDDLSTLCRKFRAGLDTIQGVQVPLDATRTIGLSVLEHLHAQLMQHFPSIPVQEHRALAMSIIDGVACAVHASAHRTL